MIYKEADSGNRSIRMLSTEILQNARIWLYDLFPYLDAAFSELHIESVEQMSGIQMDGEKIYFSPDSVIQLYKEDQKQIMRGYLHMLLHCLYFHPWPPSEELNPVLWDIACDLSVELVIERENRDELCLNHNAIRDEILKEMKHRNLSTYDIYAMLMNEQMKEPVESLHRLFSFDDHSIWYKRADEGKTGKLRRKWEKIQSYTKEKKDQKKVGSQAGTEEESANAEGKGRYDYRQFLKQFSVLREEVELDLESFDYIFYHLGMETYGDMPLIEPLEYKEVNRLEELVIAIDTSGSCSHEIVEQFLTETFQMLSQKENFFQKMNVHLIQCDTHIENAVVIHSREEWEKYCADVRIYGRGGTDFRPVFRYIEEKQKTGEIRNLRALLYFTDGDGIYPKEKPSYETAFVFLKEKAKTDQVPHWAIKLLI